MEPIRARFAHITIHDNTIFKLLKPTPRFTCSRILVHELRLIVENYAGEDPPQVPATIETLDGHTYGPIQYRVQHGAAVYFEYLDGFKITRKDNRDENQE